MPSNVTVHEDDIDNDVLIEEVERRPALFDKKLKEYSDINMKIKGWEEISRIIFSSVWGNLSSQQKTDAGKLVQKRWTNLRSCFSRELREQKSTKSGQAAKKRRKYKHFDQLLFLLPSMEARETTGNAASVQENDGEEDSGDNDEDAPQQSVRTRKKSTNKVAHEERLLDILDRKRMNEDSLIEVIGKSKNGSDEDNKEKHFALSLVPLLKSVPEENKLEVQIKILQIFQDVQRQNSHRMMQSSFVFQQPGELGQHQNNDRSSTGQNYSPMHISQHYQVRPKYSVCIPSVSPHNRGYTPTSHPYSSPSSLPAASPISYCDLSSPEHPSASNSIQSYVAHFTPDLHEDSEIYDICQSHNISTEDN